MTAAPFDPDWKKHRICACHGGLPTARCRSCTNWRKPVGQHAARGIRCWGTNITDDPVNGRTVGWCSQPPNHPGGCTPVPMKET